MFFPGKREIKCNWKLIKDAFQEAYHVAFLHTRSLPDSFTSRDNPFGHALDFRLFKRHCQLSAFGNPEHKPSPVEALAYIKLGHSSFPTSSQRESLPPGVNPTRDPRWSLDLNIFFPNFFVDVGHGTYFTYNFWPLAADRSLWEVRSYFPKAHTAAQRFSQEYSKVIFRDILTEDASTLEQTQEVLTSGGGKKRSSSSRTRNSWCASVTGCWKTISTAHRPSRAGISLKRGRPPGRPFL